MHSQVTDPMLLLYTLRVCAMRTEGGGWLLAPLWVVTRRRCRRECGCGVRLHTRIRRRVWAAARARGANRSAAVILAAPALSRPPAHVTKGRAERAVLNICGAFDTLVCPSSAVGRGHAPRTAVGLACVGPYCQRLWPGTTAAPQPLGGLGSQRLGWVALPSA